MNRKLNKIKLHTTFTESDLRLVMSDSEFNDFIEKWYQRKMILQMKETIKTDFQPIIKQEKYIKRKGYFSATGEFNNGKQE